MASLSHGRIWREVLTFLAAGQAGLPPPQNISTCHISIHYFTSLFLYSRRRRELLLLISYCQTNKSTQLPKFTNIPYSTKQGRARHRAPAISYRAKGTNDGNHRKTTDLFIYLILFVFSFSNHFWHCNYFVIPICCQFTSNKNHDFPMIFPVWFYKANNNKWRWSHSVLIQK